MTDLTGRNSVPQHSESLFVQNSRTRRRNAAEKRFRGYGIAAIIIAVLALLLLLGSVLSNGIGAFRQTYVTIPVLLDSEVLDPSGNHNPEEMKKVLTLTYGRLLKQSLEQVIEEDNIKINGLSDKDIEDLISKEAPAQIRNKLLASPDLLDQTIEMRVLTSGRIDGYYKGRVTMASAQTDNRTSPRQLELADALKEKGRLATVWNWAFLTGADASDQRPEAAGVAIAMLGSLYMMLVVLFLAVPVGVAASIYLEEFAPKNFWTDVIEVNIANLAAVPSIVFGILGLAAFINFAGLPQSAPIVGGLVLTLMTLPTIIISARAALKAVPPSIRDAALGVGASRMQTVFHHVLPLALPGILTGVIIGLAQALGETAPLLLIGMVAFVQNFPAPPPSGLFDPASALPVQIYNWTQRADPAFFERASGAIIVLLIFLLTMNLIAIYLRRRFECRW